jgi:hypothetical protein
MGVASIFHNEHSKCQACRFCFPKRNDHYSVELSKSSNRTELEINEEINSIYNHMKL